MASVSSLDRDLKTLRLEKYTPQRANEAREWIEGALGERFGSGDLLESLKDGVALCKLINAVVGSGTIKIKQSSMPFVQMEQISHFLRACQAAPILLPQHDCFLTVDLYEKKDPAQVLQCIGAFSRRAAALQPTRFPSGIGGMKPSTLSPQTSGTDPRQLSSPRSPSRNDLPKNYTSSPPGASTWAKRSDVHSTAPAWNIAQYGWTGGASQGNQGVTFGGRRQIVSSQPQVPSLAEKERRRREQDAESERRAQEAEQDRQQIQVRQREEERLAIEEEARRWDEQSKLQREQERQAAEEEKRKWEAEEQKWREEEEQRLREEKEAQERREQDRAKPRLQSQYLSQYQAEQGSRASAESDRIKDLERQLAEARERERKYEEERQKRQHTGSSQPGAVTGSSSQSVRKEPEAPVEDEWSAESERNFLRKQHGSLQKTAAPSPRPLPVPGAQSTTTSSPRPLPVPGKKPVFPSSIKPDPDTVLFAAKPVTSPRPLPAPTASAPDPIPADPSAEESLPSPRPLPIPTTHIPLSQSSNRTDTFLASNPAPVPTRTSTFTPSEAAFNSSAEQSAEDSRRAASQQKTKAGGWAAKSLIEREMERELERAREWEESQKATQAAYERGNVDKTVGSGPGQGFNTSQYGYLGGDNLNKGGGGVFAGRRQILGPRSMGNSNGK